MTEMSMLIDSWGSMNTKLGNKLSFLLEQLILDSLQTHSGGMIFLSRQIVWHFEKFSNRLNRNQNLIKLSRVIVIPMKFFEYFACV
jgi:hypothetical protein